MAQKEKTLFEQDKNDSVSRPLADRMRPNTLEDVFGHSSQIGPDSSLVRQLEAGHLPSIIIWGPPGVGKTTLAGLLADKVDYRFITISAISSGVKDVKAIIEEARSQFSYYDKRTVLFIDEIHRFNKAQQDALLHAVESGTIVLVGATTENPSFEVIAPLLSRCQVIKLDELRKEDLNSIIDRAIKNDLLLSQYNIKFANRDALFHFGGGDARRTLNLLETAFHIAPKNGKKVNIGEDDIKKGLDQSPLYYDKKGEFHYDIISAFIKSVRGSDPDAAVYWLARMLAAGEDPTFIARRLIILASEDIGNAEPYALSLASAGFEAVRNIGMPEARIVLAQVTTYLASVPKSNAAYQAINRAESELAKGGLNSVPLHLRNAPTKLMKELDYGANYKYPHSFDGHFVKQNYLPDELADQVFYHPTELGREAKLKSYLQERWPEKKETKR